MTAELWHWTCEHSADAIERDGFLLPNAHPFLPEPLTWATDLDVLMYEALGLTMDTLGCDRGAVRVRVLDPGPYERWTRYARPLAWQVRHLLEAADGAMPAHWWVSRLPVRAEVLR